MSNAITHRARPDLPSLEMNNGLTSVVLSVLVLAGSSLAITPWQQQMVIWLASHDQSIYGLGMVDFDLAELPWDVKIFNAQKGFLLEMVTRAENQTGWVRLSYQPHLEWVMDALEQLRGLVQGFVVADVPLEPVVVEFEVVICQKHQVLQHEFGCMLCNDGA
jgi:hypothetical protein